MTRDERKKIAEDIIKLIDSNLKKSTPLFKRFQAGTKKQRIKIIRDVLNYYIDVDFVPEKAEGLAIEKAVGMIVNYLEGKKNG